MYACACVPQNVCRSEVSLGELALPFSHGLRGRTQATRLGRKHVYLLSGLAVPGFVFTLLTEEHLLTNLC